MNYDEEQYNPCTELDKIKKSIKSVNQIKKKFTKECEETLYGQFVKTYFSNTENGKKLTHFDLLNGLFLFYKNEKKNDINFILTFQNFIQRFPRDTPTKETNFKRQHIFEALCRLLLLYNYDDGELGNEKHFFDSLENMLKKTDKMLTHDDILKTNVNEGSKGGIVDILFKTDISITKESEKKLSACEYNNTPPSESESTPSQKLKPTTIMIQNKYFDVEKTNIDKYDITRIHTLASKINIDNKNNKIILMINNEEALSATLLKAKQNFSDIIDKIYGVVQLDKWFQKMLYDMYNIETIDNYINIKQGKKKYVITQLEPRFHQLLVTESTLEYNKIYNTKKFIWGAVPRSGKSYMIGDLINKRTQETFNDIVIILGAKTETEQQFKEMFEKFNNFDKYDVITPEKNKEERHSINKKIYILSQEWFKKEKIDKNNTFKKVVREFFPRLLEKGKHIDLFFDEIHKGGSTDNSSSILEAFINDGVNIDLFIMVTATFAKPNLKYDESFMNGTTQIIEWSYNDQQNMKQVINETKKQMMINSRNSDIEKAVISKLFNDYQVRYGLPYLQVLSDEYQKYPELVLITPELLITDKSQDIDVDFTKAFIDNLKCNACKQNESIEFYRTTSNIFSNERPVTQLLDYIGSSIYNSFQNDFLYPISSSHTELWFLPDKNLYESSQDCREVCKPSKEEKYEEEDDIKETEEEQHAEAEEQPTEEQPAEEQHAEEKVPTNSSIPNIEPLTRGLSLKIINNKHFERYNVFIVHGTNLNYLGKQINYKKLFGKEIGKIKIYDSFEKVSLKDQIKNFEKETYSQGKSLIILTGAKLRLGVSLPCVDIAFNFDNIKSVDNNYQTMFRVLTEREKPNLKKYGYYIDFNMRRSIEFLYEYSAVYGEKNKNKNIQEQVEYLQSLLFSFNYNGLNLIRKDSKTELTTYKTLIEKLELSQEKYVDYWIKGSNLVNSIKKSLNLSTNKEQLKQLADILKITQDKEKQKKMRIALIKGHKMGKAKILKIISSDDTKSEEYKELYSEGYNEGYYEGYNDGDMSYKDEPIKEPMYDFEFKDENDKIIRSGYADGYAKGYNDKHDELFKYLDDELQVGNIIDRLSLAIPSIISLLALFSQENDLNCKSINECLENSIQQVDSFTSLCNCSNINEANIIDCYLNSPSNIDSGNTGTLDYTKDGIITILKFIQSELSTNSFLFSFLEIKFNTIIQEMKHSNDALIKTMKPEEILKFIEENLTIKKEEKNKYGEVFTPPKLINEMLDRLPSEVWHNPELTWLDPANGIGNFPMLVYHRLMKGLEKKIPSESDRGNHILKNMLYMVEINPKNVKISRKIFGPNANISCADFLNETDKWKKEFKGLDKFDVIIGNPPFQKEQEGVRTGGKANTKIWHLFIKDAFKILNPKGFLGFINPPPWRKPEEELWNLLAHENQLVYLHIFNKKQGQQLFHVSQRIDLYIVEKKTQYKDTEIIDEVGNENKIDLKQWGFLPNYAFNNIKKIMTSEDNGIKVIYDSTTYHTSHIKSTKSREGNNNPIMIDSNKPIGIFKYPIVHTITKQGIGLWHADKKIYGKHFDNPKVLLNKNEQQYPVNDFEGNYGMSQVTFGIPIKSKKEGDDIVKAINSEEFKEIIKSTKWGVYETEYKMFKYFKPDFYKYFLKETPKSPSPKLIKSPSPSPKLTKTPSPSPKSPKSPSSKSPKSPSKTLKKTPSPKKLTRKNPEKNKDKKLKLGGTKKNKNKIKKYTIKHKRK